MTYLMSNCRLQYYLNYQTQRSENCDELSVKQIYTQYDCVSVPYI